ncbi:MAG: dethiobiotin synthase [Solirubrobacteraceae bacterium]
MRGLFVSGTDTGAGKTIVSAALLAAMRAEGEFVRAHKPVVTGISEPSGEWPADHDLLAAAAGMDPHEVAPLRFGPAVSPQLAAVLAGKPIEPLELVERARTAGAIADSEEGTGRSGSQAPVLIVEGVGGLLVPLAEDFAVRDLAAELALPLIIAARPGLGTINHTLLTLQAARSAALAVRAVVLTPWRDEPSEIEQSNRETISRLGDVEVATLDTAQGPDLAELARLGNTLPWRRWLAVASHT